MDKGQYGEKNVLCFWGIVKPLPLPVGDCIFTILHLVEYQE